MKLAIGGFSLESATFLPGLTDLADFEKQACRGPEMIDRLRHTNTAGGGFIRVCEAEGVEPAALVYTDAGAAGAASDRAFEAYAAELGDGLRRLDGRADGLLLHLHGALATPTRQNADTELLREIRKVVGRRLPIMVALDLHGNLDPAMIDVADALFGYRQSPHIDAGETGERAAKLMIAGLRGEVRAACALAKADVVLPSVFTATALGPLSEIMRQARDWEARDARVLDVSVFTGFAYADVAQIGFSVAAVTDGERALAERVTTDLAERIWALRHDLYGRELLHGVVDGVTLALEKAGTAKKPIVLLEHADRANDSTYVLRELLKQGARSAAVPFLWDPAAAARAVAAGEGAEVTLEVGGKSSDRAGGPVTIRGKVLQAGEKTFLGTGPMRRGRVIDLGPAAVIDAGGIVVSLTSNSITAIDEDPFTQFGMNARDFDIIVLRSKTHFRAVYESLGEEILLIETPDWGPADLVTLPYRNVRPGVFPITAGP
jgi:microcystin degradation protein MlrC